MSTAVARVTPKPALIVDAHAPGNSGLGRYTREMALALAQRDDFRMIYLAGDPAVVSEWLVAIPTCTPMSIIPFTHLRHSPRVPFDWARVEAEVTGPRVSWFPHWDGAWAAQPGVTTIHDLIQLEQPGLAGRAKAAVARVWIAKVVQGAAALVSGSAHAAARITAQFPAAAGKFTVIHHGVAEVFSRAARSPGARRSIAGLTAVAAGAPYLLTVGNKREHKRFETAIRAFARVAAERPDLRLVMVGNRDAHYAALRALAESLGVAARVEDVQALADADLAQLYADAEALLVTSREEGFGLIAVEAMAAGTPVVAVNSGPLPEVVGDAGVLVPFDDDAAMAAALRTLDREALIARGRTRAATFTWSRAAAELSRLLVSVAR